MESSISYFNINWLSENDGPGKRLVVFLQGCKLDCLWCHSPHSKPDISPLLYFDSLCRGCGLCQEICKNSVHSFIDKTHIVQREKCVTCGNCIDACPNSSAYKRSGVLVLPTINSSVSALFEKIKPHLELLRDIGGITFSGGEPLIQHKALSVLAKKCKDSGFHTALETSGIVPVEYIQDIYPFIDTWLIGMRLTNGHDNNTDLFEKNTRNTLSYLTKNSCKEIIARFPVIPRFTTSESDLSKVYDILVEYGIKKIEVLPLNPETSHYYNAMDLPAYFEGNEINTNNEFKSVFDFFNKN